MVKLKKISIEEVKAVRRTLKPSAIVQEYTQIIKELPTGEAREIDAKVEKEKPQSIKNRINRLATSLNMAELQVKRVGDKVYIWKEEIEPKKKVTKIES